MQRFDFSVFNDDKHFESFVQEVLFEILGSNFISSASAGKDGGMDGFFSGKLLEKEGNFIFEVKYSAEYTGIDQQRRTIEKQISSAMKSRMDVYREKADTIIFLTNTLLTMPKKLEFRDLAKNEYGLDVMIWDQTEIQFLLSKAPFAREKYFPTTVPPISLFLPDTVREPDFIFEREKLLEDLETFLSSSKTFLQLIGSPGSGKTFILKELARKQTADHIFYLVHSDRGNLEQFTRYLNPSKIQVFVLDNPTPDFVDQFKQILLQARLKPDYKFIVMTRRKIESLQSEEIIVPNLSLSEAKEFFDKLAIVDDNQKREVWTRSNGNMREVLLFLNKIVIDPPVEYRMLLEGFPKLSDDQRTLITLAAFFGPLRATNWNVHRIYGTIGFRLDDVYQIYDELKEFHYLSEDREVIDIITPRLKQEITNWIIINRPETLTRDDLIGAILINHEIFFRNLGKNVQYNLENESIIAKHRSWLGWLLNKLIDEKIVDLHFMSSLGYVSFYFASTVLRYLKDVYDQQKSLFDPKIEMYSSFNAEYLLRGLRPVFYDFSLFRSAFELLWDIFIDHPSNALVNQYMYELIRFEEKKPFKYQIEALKSIVRENDRKADTTGNITKHIVRLFSLEIDDYEWVFSEKPAMRFFRGKFDLSSNIIEVLNEGFVTLTELIKQSSILNREFLQSIDTVLLDLEDHLQNIPESSAEERDKLLDLLQRAVSFVEEIFTKLDLSYIDEIMKIYNRVNQIIREQVISTKMDGDSLKEKFGGIPVFETIELYSYLKDNRLTFKSEQVTIFKNDVAKILSSLELKGKVRVIVSLMNSQRISFGITRLIRNLPDEERGDLCLELLEYILDKNNKLKEHVPVILSVLRLSMPEKIIELFEKVNARWTDENLALLSFGHHPAATEDLEPYKNYILEQINESNQNEVARITLTILKSWFEEGFAKIKGLLDETNDSD
ncbi:MAG: hypothetical protein ACFFD4_31955, partial [Candidatus Odinarchaeota archaeon]